MRYLNDGKLVFEGRVDEQVKLHGYRIELGEIEAALQRLPGVMQAAAVVRAAAAGHALVAYVAGQTAEPAALRQALGRTLPEYMVPGMIVRLPALPQTASGKLDRKALPAPESVTARAQGQAPRNLVERDVAAIWSDLLEIDDIGVAENFFELGGHSVLAMQIIARIRDRFSVEVPLRVLFEHPTIQELGRFVELAERAPDMPADGQSEELEDGVI